MSSHRPAQESSDVGGPALKGGDFYSPGFWAQNGCGTQSEGATASRPATTPAVPKMGVRARIADWPPKREGLKDPTAPSTSRDLETPASLPQGFQNGQLPSGAALPGHRGSQRLPRGRSTDAEFQGGWPRSPGRGFPLLRNRSSSETTLGEGDWDEVPEPRGSRLAGGLPLFREYGSTSSIDVQGISEQSFCDMLNEFRSGKPVALPPPQDSFRASRAPKAEGRGELGAPLLGEDLPFPHKEKSRKKGPRVEAGGGESIFRKLRSGRGDHDTGRAPAEAEDGARAWVCQKSFAHYDVQSMLFDLNEAAARRVSMAQRRNTTTGASAASAAISSRACGLGGLEAPASFMGTEDPNHKEDLEHDPGDNNSNALLLSCPHFRNEIGGEPEHHVSFLQASAGSPGVGSCGEGGVAGAPPAPRCTNASISVLEVPRELQRNVARLKQYSIEHVDLGARYYQDYFCGKEHSNYFGVDEKLGPVAVSIRREKLEDHREHGPQYQYRIIFRTSELTTLRGAILEDATPTATKHGTVRGLPFKDALEYVVPELNSPCLRLALSVPKVTEQLRKLDEQGLCSKHKVGVLYCKAGQSSEEEMYNNEEAGPALEEFLALLGEKVRLRGFSKYSAQLDTKTDSTGTHSLYTTCQGYEIMFHVATMLPYTPNNRQQLLRKRHIGNDIVTIIFQEPGALPFTPQNIRSHFQHVFIIVRAQNPCTENVCYSVAVTRSKDVPPFGPAIPSRAVFRKSDAFRDFLLAKVINAENAAHKSEKFHTMATRTRQEYLRDLAENCVTSTPIDSTGKFNLISLASKKKEKTKARTGAEQHSAGAVAWRTLAQDYSRGAELACILAISNEFVLLLDVAAKEVVFNCFCADVIGWTPDAHSIKIFHGRGDHIFVRALEDNPEDIREIVQRLKVMTSGCETVEMTLRRNGLGQLGFHVKFDGTVAEVEDYGFAWQAGLRQGSRLVEICKVAVVTLSHDQMIDWLRTSVTVKVVVVPPHEDGLPRRGWTESFRMSTAEPKMEPESLPVGYRPPYRSGSLWQWGGAPPHGSSHAPKWAEQPGAGQGQSQSLTRAPRQGAPSASYRESQLPQGKRPVSFPETPHAASASQTGAERIPSYRQPSGSFSTPGSSGAAYAPRYKSSSERCAAPLRHLVPFSPPCAPEAASNGDSSSGGLASQGSTMERSKAEPLWHVPAQGRLSANSGGKRPNRHEPAGKDSPGRPSKGEGQYSSSNTLSSTASSGHSDERWFDAAEPAEPDPDPLAKGGSSDSGIDASGAQSAWRDRLPRASPPFGAGKRRDALPAAGSSGQGWIYRPVAFGLGGGVSPRATGGGGSHFKQSSHGNSRATCPAHVYKTPPADAPRGLHMPQSGSFPLSASVPKSFFSKQSRNKHLPAGWRKSEDRPSRPATFTDPKKQVDLSTKNVFGQPRLRASLRDLRSPRKTYKSTIEDDLKKLIIMEPDRELSPQKTLQRTLSDESLCSARRAPAYASTRCPEQPLPGDVLFTSTLPVRKQNPPSSSGSLSEKSSAISASELSLSDARDKPLRRIDPGLMPLPDAAAGLEWSSLVSAAKAYEVQRAVSLFSLNDAVLSPDAPPAHSPVLGHLSLERPPAPRTTPTMSEEPPGDLTGKVYQLEAMLKQLHSDLQKEKEDKVVLQAEVASLRQNNQRLQEESQAANERLREFAEIFSSAVEKKEL
ncbi:signal-induced proliferation-associated 1-like protein 3 isoform X1 [Varanus komodoensis]|uniref:signal-induced proliferation-associated 1-like protein 3 isoform X1 n=1 Tax=Varanus komodoensis TaxID=61221 RepID=UPI001CF7EB59|nr:signal-induced proliferation-associated 1-like protein 3 isoform X1 [Varanus komodoensis]XP_044281339.1 signal-induced proliferation-associated 1-like protein 3 isoform X1 [Varanus komodoensis]